MGKGLGYLIGKLILGAVGYAVADAVTKNHTDRHIHEHVFAWYRRAHHEVTQWAQAQGNRKALRILAEIDRAVTSVYNRVNMMLFAYSPNEQPVLIYEERVPLAELRQQFGPGVKVGRVYDVTEAMLG
ncbi:MAG TPA: hypothetical protein PLK04_10785 [Bacillota bacterium]|nr:hypothetical protein [Bacillota bacterium]